MWAIFGPVVSSVAGLISRVSRALAAGGDANRDINTAMQTAAVGWTGFAITMAINVPNKVEPHHEVAYDAHLTFLCLTFFPAVYTTLHYLRKEEMDAAAGQRRGRKMMDLTSISGAIAFALRIYIAAYSLWRVLLITAAASVFGLLYLLPDVNNDQPPPVNP